MHVVSVFLTGHILYLCVANVKQELASNTKITPGKN